MLFTTKAVLDTLAMVYFTRCKDEYISQVSECILAHNGLLVGMKCAGQKAGHLIFLILYFIFNLIFLC